MRNAVFGERLNKRTSQKALRLQMMTKTSQLGGPAPALAAHHSCPAEQLRGEDLPCFPIRKEQLDVALLHRSTSGASNPGSSRQTLHPPARLV